MKLLLISIGLVVVTSIQPSYWGWIAFVPFVLVEIVDRRHARHGWWWRSGAAIFGLACLAGLWAMAFSIGDRLTGRALS